MFTQESLNSCIFFIISSVNKFHHFVGIINHIHLKFFNSSKNNKISLFNSDSQIHARAI